MTLSEIAAITLSTRSPMYFLNFETKMKRPKELMDVNLADDHSFMDGDKNVTINKVCHDNCASKIVSTLQESQEPATINDTIEQRRTDNLLTICLREYHTWKIPGIENDIKRNDFFASNRAVQQEQSACYGLFRLNGFTSFGSLGNKGFRNLPSYSVPHRDFSSKSCTVIQSSAREIEILRKDLFNANLSIIRLRSTREAHPGRVFLQSFSCDASKKSSEENDGCKSQQRSGCGVESVDSCTQKPKSRCGEKEDQKKCGKTRSRRKDTCGLSSRNDRTCEKQESKSESCKRYICPDISKRRCNAERAEKATKNMQSKDCSQKQNIDRCSQKQRSKSCTQTQRKDCEEPRNVCKSPMKKKDYCKSKAEKEQSKCTGTKNQKRSESCRKKSSSRDSDKNCGKIDGKRHYSQQSFFSVSRDHRSFSTLIPNIVLGTDVRKTTKALYCSKYEKSPSCEEQKRKCETKKKDKTKQKCVKRPARCMSRKSTVNKIQTCQSTTQKDPDKESCESTKKSCNHAEYCANRKLEPTKDKKPKEPSVTEKDKKPKEESMQEQIAREYKEIEECKKYKPSTEKTAEKDEKPCTEYKPKRFDRVNSPYKQKEMKDSKKFTSTPNESIFSNSMGIAYKMLSIRSIINNEIPIIPKDIKLLNVMFDRSFSTTKVSYHDDFAIKRTTGHSKMVQNSSTNNSDFHGDELPNYIEIENDDEEEDDYDWIIGRPSSGIN